MCKLTVKDTIIVLIGSAIFLAILSGILWYNKNPKNVNNDPVTVESLIKQDIQKMDSIYKDNIFWESRVVLKETFKNSSTPVLDEVTNVFQTNIEDGKDINTTVYLFIHDLKTGKDSLDIHPNAWVSSDLELNIDSIKVDFTTAFNKAKQSQYAQPTSRYITLRHGLGRAICNPFYSIGNQNEGHLWVDAINSNVYDKDPAD